MMTVMLTVGKLVAMADVFEGRVTGRFPMPGIVTDREY